MMRRRGTRKPDAATELGRYNQRSLPPGCDVEILNAWFGEIIFSELGDLRARGIGTIGIVRRPPLLGTAPPRRPEIQWAVVSPQVTHSFMEFDKVAWRLRGDRELSFIYRPDPILSTDLQRMTPQPDRVVQVLFESARDRATCTARLQDHMGTL